MHPAAAQARTTHLSRVHAKYRERTGNVSLMEKKIK